MARSEREPSLRILSGPGAICVLGLAMVLCVGLAGTNWADRLDDDRAAQTRLYASKLSDLAGGCTARGLSDLARRVAGWQLRPAPATSIIVRIPEGAAAQLQNARSGHEARMFQQLRQTRAAELYRLAQRAADESRVALALELLLKLLREDPDHAPARKLLGYEKLDGRWVTRAAALRIRKGQVWHEKFGWLDKKHVARYERGERYYQGHWLLAANEAERRTDIARGWNIETDHFLVTTNHSLEAGVELAQRLERLHHAWSVTFAAFATRASELKRRFAGTRPPPTSNHRHKVVYFKNRTQYNQALARMQPGIERSIGIYFPDTRTSFFFAGEDQDPATVFHEATHQMFWEVRPARPNVGGRDNFWIVEGIACYMETLRLGAHHDTLGGHDAGRMPAARQRLLEDNFYVTFGQIVRLGQNHIQRRPDARTLYSQFSGQAAFLMHAEGGRYRAGLVDYLAQLYGGRARIGSLSKSTGQTLTQLDAAYHRFVRTAKE